MQGIELQAPERQGRQRGLGIGREAAQDPLERRHRLHAVARQARHVGQDQQIGDAQPARLAGDPLRPQRGERLVVVA